MPRKKNKNSEPVLSLKEQIETYIFKGIVNFEQLSGVPVSRVDIVHRKGIGFNSKDSIEVNIIT